MTVTRGDSTFFSGELAANDTVLVAGYQVTIPRLRNWCYIHVVGNPWLVLVFAGFWLALIGMTVSVMPRVWSKKEQKA